jgi:hypothetical protein
VNDVISTLIWAGVAFVPSMTLVVWLAPSLRRAISMWTSAHAVTANERDAAVQQVLVDLAERRNRLAVTQSLLAEETASERARLEAQTAQYRTDEEAAGRVLGEAVDARRKVIAARARAEAELAPEAARAAMSPGSEMDMKALGDAYAAYCARADYPWPFGQWVGNFRGLG